MNSSILNRSMNSSFGQDGLLPEHLNESSEYEEAIVNNDGGDSLSDSSDDTSYTTWKPAPPLDNKQHCYANEMRVSIPDMKSDYPRRPRSRSWGGRQTGMRGEIMAGGREKGEGVAPSPHFQPVGDPRADHGADGKLG